MERTLKILTTMTLLLFGFSARSQQADSATTARAVQARRLYNDAQKLRTGTESPMDYQRAFELYDKAAALGDPRAEYAVGYMRYKGLGCEQDYFKAVELFKKGASRGMDNAMYFLGLCLRNGYGTERDTAQARRWLHEADSLGNRQARHELAAIAAENRADSARELLAAIKDNPALPDRAPVNSFVRVANRLPAGEAAAGRYRGYLVQYDWSGRNVVDARPMALDLRQEGGRLSGQWVEQGRDSFRFDARVRYDSVVFEPVSYGRRDHYSPDSAVAYRLDNAAFNVVQSLGAVYLAGNVTMFSPQRGEPSKPLVLALVRTSEPSYTGTSFTFDRVYPNPFRDVLDVQFSIGSDADVSVSVVNMAGVPVYSRGGQRLQKGSYSYRLQLPYGMAPGAYILQVLVNGKPNGYKLLHI